MPKRGENIYKRKDGRWEGRIRKYVDDRKWKYRSVYGKSYHEVKEKMCRMKQETESKGAGEYTVAEAAELWIQARSPYWKAGTCSVYRQMLNKYIIPYMGGMPVRRITNQVLLDFMTNVNTQNVPLSRNYMFQICSAIRRILSYINRQYDLGIVIPDNPVSKEHAHNILLPSESTLTVLADYLLANSDNDTCLGILIALHTGIRIGELSALRWKDIDLEEGVLYIRSNIIRVYKNDGEKENGCATQILAQKPKSSDSVRIIPLPACLIPILREHRKEESRYVVSGVKAMWAEPRTIQYRFENILKKCQIENFNFHMLRHAFATRCVSMGLDVKSLSEILGHSDIQLTLNLYVHSSIQQKRLLMQQYDAVIR